VTYSCTSGSDHRLRATTILGVTRNGEVALAGDGQVTLGDVVLKHGARKIRTMHNGQILAGFAGAVADALTLFAKFDAHLKAWEGELRRASVELAREWRGDRYLRRLEAQLLVADPDSILIISGEGDVIEPDDGIAAIGSGAPYATSAAKALLRATDLGAREIVERSMAIAAELCIYTNDHFSVESIRRTGQDQRGAPVHLDTHDDRHSIESLTVSPNLPGSADGENDEAEDEAPQQEPKES
jgi:ATP-dependent HslUV protease subunit HslV